MDPKPVTTDVVIVGAGVTGLYQLYRALQAGFTATVLEAGDGVGGTWYWNRYPQARFDSESYTYVYIFSKELFEEWEWSEHFAGQPEIERYFNHFVDRFELRKHVRFNAKVTSAVFDEQSGTYTVQAADGGTYVTRYLIAATGVLSVPFYPEVPGREEFQGEAYHTGLWPAEPVDFTGKRVAVIGTGASGVQLIPAIADEVESLTVYQRSPNWCTPLNNRPLTPEEQADLRVNYEKIREEISTNPSGFLHETNERTSDQDSREERLAFFEQLWNSQGFRKMTANYADFFDNEAVNREFCDFLEDKIRSIVEDPVTADKLIPKNHLYGQKRPPFVTGYYEVYNRPNVSLINLHETPMERVTATGIETADGLREFDIIVWATGFDFGSGALNRMGIVGRGGVPLTKSWEDGVRSYLGLQTVGFPNLFFPGGPHGAGANVPRYTSDQVDFVMELLELARKEGYDVIEPTEEAEREWLEMVNTMAEFSPLKEKVSYFFGSNIPGKPRQLLLNPAGRVTLFEHFDKNRENGYAGFELSRSTPERGLGRV
jgi:cation diffusion facilitator CzcD-associated flavoprotein CzcO